MAQIPLLPVSMVLWIVVPPSRDGVHFLSLGLAM